MALPSSCGAVRDVVSRPPVIRPALARRIDRLAVAAHAFHRFAHHPLCDRYASELVMLGHRRRVCRGCSMAILGLALGVTAGWLTRSVDVGRAAWLAPAAAALLTLAPLGRSKLLRRFLPAFAFAAAASHGPRMLSAISVLIPAALLALYRRGGPNRGPCVTCPQRTREVCEGFAPIVRREAAFRRLSGQWLKETH
jgi:hypothetical protein